MTKKELQNDLRIYPEWKVEIRKEYIRQLLAQLAMKRQKNAMNGIAFPAK